jgi:hypothetical protein
MQVTDTREQLQSNLALWKKRMLNKIERIHEQLLGKQFRSFIETVWDLLLVTIAK